MAEPDWVTLGVGFVGALVGGAATLAGARWQLAAAARDQRERENRHHAAILRAVHDELETMRDMYNLTVGSSIAALPENKPFYYYWPVNHDYFTVYNGNAVFIGHISDVDLRKEIIVAYTRARALIDSFRLNNWMVERREMAYLTWQQAQTPANLQALQSRDAVLTDYAATLKKGHVMLNTSLDTVLRSLRKAGVLNPIQAG
ncbi:hypothetical protein [Ralstonia pseudosolanacearum]|uniref:hypothetical protein n=1 Tax=Ralstonia pseudosolanacearum TaxID=1310165 RepID=UPI001FF71FB2|nr:hypothetical protein [Ralstonia pseudosolanacearum]